MRALAGEEGSRSGAADRLDRKQGRRLLRRPAPPPRPRQKHFRPFDALFDGQPIILLRLPQLELGSKARSFGSLFLAYLMAVVARRGIAPPINVYIDDCDVFDTPVPRKLVVQSRRLNLSVTLINQYLDQLTTDLRTSLLGSAQIRVMFRCGIEDSAYLHKSLPTDNNAPLLHQLDPYQAIYFDGRSNRIEDIKDKPLPRGNVKTARELVEKSRRRYGLVAESRGGKSSLFGRGE